ncbi:hypothetical protein BHM03_00032122, partial [Ensete ventricosum]
GKAPYCPIHTGRYTDRPLPGGTAKIDRRRLISTVNGRFRLYWENGKVKLTYRPVHMNTLDAEVESFPPKARVY